jgi:ribosomal protein S18 acetylase RimI-like enzyme
MKTKLEIIRLEGDQINESIDLLKAFYPTINSETLSERLSVISKLNWACIGVYADKKLAGLTGYWINTRLYCGKYLYIDHFIVDPQFRKHGIGEKLLLRVKEIAIEEACNHVCLDTFISNSLAQKFWYKHGFNIVGFHFVNNLN